MFSPSQCTLSIYQKNGCSVYISKGQQASSNQKLAETQAYNCPVWENLAWPYEKHSNIIGTPGMCLNFPWSTSYSLLRFLSSWHHFKKSKSNSFSTPEGAFPSGLEMNLSSLGFDLACSCSGREASVIRKSMKLLWNSRWSIPNGLRIPRNRWSVAPSQSTSFEFFSDPRATWRPLCSCNEVVALADLTEMVTNAFAMA